MTFHYILLVKERNDNKIVVDNPIIARLEHLEAEKAEREAWEARPWWQKWLNNPKDIEARRRRAEYQEYRPLPPLALNSIIFLYNHRYKFSGYCL